MFCADMEEDKSIKVILIEPFFTGSHARWCEDLKKYSSHSVEIVSLEGRHWKWRMHGGAISIAQKLKDKEADILVVSDMIDLALLKALLPNQLANVPIALYMHENQLTYPWSPDDADVQLKRDRHYGFINYTSALVADHLFFNSQYHLDSFTGALPDFLAAFPDHNNLELIEIIKAKSNVLPLGLDLQKFQAYRSDVINEIPVILWNHRWEYDKSPAEFFKALFELKKEGLKFRLIVLGESYSKAPAIFKEAKAQLTEEIIHWGWVESFEEYSKLLCTSDILPVTSNQDFFGGSIVEAIYCNVMPLLPNRLAYPEHVDQKYLYEQGEFISKLRFLILNRNQFDGSYLIKYDWSKLIQVYDTLLERLHSSVPLNSSQKQ